MAKGIEITGGDEVFINVPLQYSDGVIVCDPEGAARKWKDLLLPLPVNGSGRGAVVGRIGPKEAIAFRVGRHRRFTASHSGRLFLGVNEIAGTQSDCGFVAGIQVNHATKSVTSKMQTQHPITITPDLLDQVPRRVLDIAQNQGDMVNFVIVGSQESMESAFQAAGWSEVDRNAESAAIHVLVASIAKQVYTEMPMSELYLFGRVQDYGYARAEPIQVITSRHHLRVWKAPFEVASKAVWVGAATHDIGLEKDVRNGSITHQIDPNVDRERDFLSTTFLASGGARFTTRILPSHPVLQGKTATGSTFRSDGRVLIMVLAK